MKLNGFIRKKDNVWGIEIDEKFIEFGDLLCDNSKDGDIVKIQIGEEDLFEKLIEENNITIDDLKDLYNRYTWNISKCKELIEKDLAKKVSIKNDKKICPVCEKGLSFEKFCPNCGQRIEYIL